MRKRNLILPALLICMALQSGCGESEAPQVPTARQETTRSMAEEEQGSERNYTLKESTAPADATKEDQGKETELKAADENDLSRLLDEIEEDTGTN